MKKVFLLSILTPFFCFVASAQCNFGGLTAVPGPCNPATNTYTLTGTITFSGAPSTGTLTVYNGCGGSAVLTPPFSSPANYSIPGVTADGAFCTIAVAFSADGSCGMTQNYTAPAACGPSGITEKEGIKRLSVSPNPSNGISYLSFESFSEKASVTVKDILGKTIYSSVISNNSGMFKERIDLNPLKKGIYFIQVISGESTATRKIILE